MPTVSADILENNLSEQYPEAFTQLLRDHTTQKNIFWATHDYESLGAGFQYSDNILPENITGANGTIIKPRVLKSKEDQTGRVKDMAEVFTPSWICNAQNNLVDEAWFGRPDVFNVEDPANHSWQTTPSPVTFPEGKTWRDYVRATRMEITCGEAPYLVSRYDATTGKFIPLTERIGLLDRKLRVVSENVHTSGEWLKWAQTAYQNIYGYDGLKGVVPDSCRNGITEKENTLFGEEERTIWCEGCQKEDLYEHNGRYCLVHDWKNDKNLRFIDLIK